MCFLDVANSTFFGICCCIGVETAVLAGFDGMTFKVEGAGDDDGFPRNKGGARGLGTLGLSPIVAK